MQIKCMEMYTSMKRNLKSMLGKMQSVEAHSLDCNLMLKKNNS